MQTEFQKLMKLLKRRYGFTQREIAYMLGTRQATLSRCLHGHQGCTGRSFVVDLRQIVRRMEEGQP